MYIGFKGRECKCILVTLLGNDSTMKYSARNKRMQKRICVCKRLKVGIRASSTLA